MSASNYRSQRSECNPSLTIKGNSSSLDFTAFRLRRPKAYSFAHRAILYRWLGPVGVELI